MIETVRTEKPLFDLRQEVRVLVSRTGDRKVAYLNVIRGLAVSMVIAAHFNTAPLPYPAEISLVLGNCGVILFFFLSGFLMDRTLARDNRLGSYAIRRMFRILPMYWASILFAFIMTAGWTLGDVLANATFAAPAFHTERMLGVYWTLYIEVLFYCLVPFVRQAGERAIKFAPYAFIAAFALWAAIAGRMNAAAFYVLFCFAGMQIGAWTRGQIGFGWLIAALAAISASASTLSGVSIYLGLAPFVCSVLFLLAMRQQWSWRPMEIIGDVSYSWYLLHSLFGYWMMELMRDAGSPNWLLTWSGIIVSLAISSLTYVLIERPMIAFGHVLARRLMPLRTESAVA